MNKPITVSANVPFEMTRLALVGRHLSVFRRRTWTVDSKHWITDYGFELFGAALFVHVPSALHPDGCCSHGQDEHPSAPHSSVPPLTASILRGMRSGLAHSISRPPKYLQENEKAWESLVAAYQWACSWPVTEEDDTDD